MCLRFLFGEVGFFQNRSFIKNQTTIRQFCLWNFRVHSDPPADCNKNPPCFLASRSLRVHIRLLLLLLLLFHPLCTLPAHQPHARHLCIPSPQAPLVGTMAGAAADRYGVQWLVLLAALCQGISYFGASVTDQYLPLLLWCA